MPKISKVSKAIDKSSEVSKRDAARYTCTRCGRVFNKQRGNFPTSHSQLFAKNSGYLPICGECVDELHKEYSSELGSDVLGAKRVCLKLDIYWDAALYDATKRTANTQSAVLRLYITKLNLFKYTGKTYDHTLREEAAAEAEAAKLEAEAAKQRAEEEAARLAEEAKGKMPEVPEPTEKMIKFWGAGYTPAEYAELNERYARWTGGVGTEELNAGAETLYRQICVLEMVIKKNASAGKSIDQTVNQLNNLIGSVNAKPTQLAKNSDDDESFDGLPIGVGIRIYENTRPIPKTLPEYQDVDGIVRYILIWVFGHLCKLFHIKNAYSQLYEDEMARLRVERPDVADEDDEDLLYDVFGDLKRENQ